MEKGWIDVDRDSLLVVGGVVEDGEVAVVCVGREASFGEKYDSWEFVRECYCEVVVEQVVMLV